MILPWQLPSWLETGLVVALGTGVVVGGAAVCVRLARPSSGSVPSGRFRSWASSHSWPPRPRGSRPESCSAGEAPASRRTRGSPLAVREAAAVRRSPAQLCRPCPRRRNTVGRCGWESCAKPHDRDTRPRLSDAMPIATSARFPGSDAELAADAGRTTSGEPESPRVAVVQASDSWDCGLAFLWGCGAALLLARMIGTRWRLLRFHQRQACFEDAGLRQRVEHLATRLGLRRRIGILASPQLAAPIAFGVARPVIVLPSGFLDDFDVRQQDAMLTHELAHLAAGDPLWQLLADLAAALLWWHPLAWWARGSGGRPANWPPTRPVSSCPRAPTPWRRAWSRWRGGWSLASGWLGWRWQDRAGDLD